MKKYIIVVCLCCLGCLSVSAQTRSLKRGVGYNTLLTGDVQALSPGLSWAYNWGQSGSGNDVAFETYGIEFVPMAWNGVNTTQLRALLSAHPEIKYILGFNEPNFKAQANLTPAQAASKWPELESIADEFGLTIVGPALNYSPDAPYQDPVKWYDEFFQACPDCRVDHIALHFYMSSATSIKANIEKFKKYEKPIWLTEFCAWDDNTSVDSQQKFLFETIDYLETDPDVFRYAWFKERGWNGGHPYMQLLDKREEGVLLPLGELFTHMSSYDENHYFGVSQRIPSEHYIRMKGIMLEKTSDLSDHLNIKDFDPTYDYVDYNVNIPEAGEYNVFFRYADQYGDVSEVRISANDEEKATMVFENKGKDVWATQGCKASFNEGKQKIRIDFKRGGLKLNWFEITKNEVPSNIDVIVGSVVQSVYPNPAKEFVCVEVTPDIHTIQLRSIDGKIVLSHPVGVHSGTVMQIPLGGINRGMYFITTIGKQPGRPEKLIIR